MITPTLMHTAVIWVSTPLHPCVDTNRASTSRDIKASNQQDIFRGELVAPELVAPTYLQIT